MSSLNGLLQQLDRVNTQTMSHHHQRPKEQLCRSSLTLTLTAEGRTFDDPDHLITELAEIPDKGASIWNGTVENCSSGRALRKKHDAILNGTETFDSCRNKVEFLSGFDGNLTVSDTSSATSHTTHLEKSPNLDSSSNSIQFPKAYDMSDEVQSLSSQKTLHMLHVSDQSSPSSMPSYSDPLCDEKDVTRCDANHTSQFLSSFPTHTRSLSQTTSQLTSLIAKAESVNVGDTSYMNNLFEGSHVDVLSDKLDTRQMKTVPDTFALHKPEISPHDSTDLRTVQDSTNSTGHSIAPVVSDVEEATAIESSPKQSQCCGDVLQSSHLEPEAEVSSLTHAPYPDWKLDRRDSGHLFWRRDSSTLNGVDPSNRVKFRYDIEVREFESRSSENEDLADDEYDDVYDDDDDDEDDDDDDDEIDVQRENRCGVSNFKGRVSVKEESLSAGTSAIVCVVAIIAVILMASYRWLLSALSLI